MSFLGIFMLLGVAWALSTNRKVIQWRPVIVGVALQLVFAMVVLAPALQEFFFTVIDGGVHRLLSFSEAGAEFVFQTVDMHEIYRNGEPETFIGRISPPVKTFAFWILPTIVFFSSLMAVLYHLRVMQPLVKVIAKVMQITMGTSGAESLAAASNIFVGQTEAPLVVKPFVEDMTKSELHALMTGGFATVAGGVMAAYVGFLSDVPGIAGHLVTASILSAPAALAVSKLMFPELGEPTTMGTVPEMPQTEGNVLEAAANGAADGMKLALNVAAMLIAFVGLMAMADWILTLVPVAFNDQGVWFGYASLEWAPEGMQIADAMPLSLSRILGWVFTPFALMMGVPWDEAATVGTLLGEKLVLTEFIAYIHLGAMVNGETAVLSERSAIIASYALCGFANFASIGIQLGGIGGIAPSRMKDLSGLAVRAMIAGTLAAFMTATVAGMILG
ncbi:MAG: NupC/NupG family nucleoside CNT transporter [Proteobacteria bacterium]|nr:NupC/NupG family nucleoside CNT transporter [Pseudomonadota bacterium]MCP4921608.1 NupC/NupG family nucleoside CNT transporter [Pseudomonadota bacterium]